MFAYIYDSFERQSSVQLGHAPELILNSTIIYPHIIVMSFDLIENTVHCTVCSIFEDHHLFHLIVSRILRSSLAKEEAGDVAVPVGGQGGQGGGTESDGEDNHGGCGYDVGGDDGGGD